ncbi:sister chromatid cohesion protein PDS5 homolog C-like [Cryptomeria japonica]|uniref:sister chromatid cohesion protein PDS5 homolog C-like n=1 Tax=Cryptomeria japonica TaxID=3369 RepID=UPI0027DAB150|nr:sister chromatid cohesion protein PDS5 homolog C-like [Cryptomeria japonica]
MKDVLITSEGDNELRKRVSSAGENLGHLSLSKDDLLSSLEELAKCLQEVKQSPSHLIQNAIALTVNSLGEHRLLRRPKNEVRLVVSNCLSEIIRITVPEIPYKDDIMKEVLQLIVESLHGLHDDKDPTFNRRTKNLDIMARTRSFVLMLDLHYDELILQMFQCLIAEIRKRHPNKLKTDMFDILSMILDENDTVCKQLRYNLLDIWRTKLHVSATAYDFARSFIELKIEKFREQLTSEELVMWGLQVSPSL